MRTCTHATRCLKPQGSGYEIDSSSDLITGLPSPFCLVGLLLDWLATAWLCPDLCKRSGPCLAQPCEFGSNHTRETVDIAEAAISFSSYCLAVYLGQDVAFLISKLFIDYRKEKYAYRSKV
uniref:Uncharacterized protein n=1 Tax=Magallana gigas TaxID=29159 RepID=K1PTA5_MAGGI